jgi:hypothetical protein
MQRVTPAKRYTAARLCLLGLLAAALPAWAASGPLPRLTAQQADHARPLRVLFIGNSYTFVNDLPAQVARLANSAATVEALQPGLVAEGGASLKRHWETGKALEAIKAVHWDYVVLQEQSTLAPAQSINGVPQIGDPATFYEYARRFDAEIKKAGARTVFFLTWAPRNAPQNQAPLTKAYTQIAGELGALLAPVGIAWQNALQQDSSLVLHQDDLSHPNSAGSYLAACVFYSLFYSRSPEGLPAPNLGKTAPAFLQRVAWQTVKSQAR